MSKTPDFFEDLRRVGALKRGLLGGQPSDYALSKPQLSRDTVGAWLRGERFPQRLEPLLAVLGEIRAEAARQKLLASSADGFSGESVAELLAEDRWRGTWEAEHERRLQSNQEGLVRQQSRKALEKEERRARQAALADRPRPVRSWSPKRLGVHPAIPGHSATPDGADFVLPTYVPRPHDDRLRANLTAAVADSASLLVVVRGESCTGKTRTAVEALTTVPDDFQLLFPTDADSLLAMLAADALGPRTVLWLNEAQHYLDGPAGEAAAAALLRRLDADGPFITLATLWPDHDKPLTTAAASSDDPHRQARALLSLAHYVHLPNSFAEHLDAVRHAASHSASLAAALEAGGADLTQTLAAGPDLVTHYEHPAGLHGIYGKALISAAMDAHRLGATAPPPLDFLREAAPGYLTDDERAAADADSWFIDALAYARRLIKQIIRPLQAVPRSSGMGSSPGVARLADYLQQHGRRTRWHLCPPASFWQAAYTHLTHPQDLENLSNAAHDRRRLQWAYRLSQRAAEHGSIDGLLRVANQREIHGDQQGAEALLRKAADLGDHSASRRLAKIRLEAGDRLAAEGLLQRAADHGDTRALNALAEMRLESGDYHEYESVYRRAADQGDTHALLVLMNIRLESGDQQGAEALLRKAADLGDHSASRRLAKIRLEAGDRLAAEGLLQRAADHGDTRALNALAEMRLESGDQQRAEALLRKAADLGNYEAEQRLIEVWDVAGNHECAEAYLLQAADQGNINALYKLANRYEKAGDWDRAEAAYRQVANRGVSGAARHLIFKWRQMALNRKILETILRQAVDGGMHAAAYCLTEILEEAGDREGAEALARKAAEHGDNYALYHLAEMRYRGGDRADAEILARHAVDCGPVRVPSHHGGIPAMFNDLWPHGLDPDGMPTPLWQL